MEKKRNIWKKFSVEIPEEDLDVLVCVNNCYYVAKLQWSIVGTPIWELSNDVERLVPTDDDEWLYLDDVLDAVNNAL